MLTVDACIADVHWTVSTLKLYVFLWIFLWKVSKGALAGSEREAYG